MKTFLRSLFLLLALAVPAKAQGTIPISGSQSVNASGQPLAGCLLYIFQSGTIATPQNAYSDTALSQILPNPMQCDQNGRLPFFYLANGSVHARLTDSTGVVQFDYPSLLVIGPSSGGGGGATFDPTAIPATGDIKFRPTTDVLAGWVRLNARTIGNGSSGATELASSTALNLFTYLWGACSPGGTGTPITHCPLGNPTGNRGTSALVDFNNGRTIQLPDFRSRSPLGLADMGGANCSGVRVDCIVAGNVTSGGGDGVTTANATGGTSNTILTQGNLPSVSLPITSEPTISLSLNLASNSVSNSNSNSNTSVVLNDPGHTHTYTQPNAPSSVGANGGGSAVVAVPSNTGGVATSSSTTGITVQSSTTATTTTTTTNTTTSDNGSTASNIGGSVALGGSGNSFANVSPFMLGTWYIKL